LYKYLLAKNIVGKEPQQPALCENSLRITVGTPEENDALLTALKRYDQ
jgi:histidinol-phosphate aminotransferase